MVKKDPDDVLSALSKNLKSDKSPVLRITFKRGGLWKPENAKVHSRVARRQLRQATKAQAQSDKTQEWPLLVRFKQGCKTKEELEKRNAEVKPGHTQQYIESLMNVFRVNFFKQKHDGDNKVVLGPTKPNPLSKRTAKKQATKVRNNQRKTKRKQIKKMKKRQLTRNVTN